MAKRHLIDFYVEQQATYNDMLETVEDLEASYKSGNMDYERYSQLRESLTEDIEKIKEDYERLSYVMFLLNIPNRVKKEDRYKKENQVYFAYLDKYSKQNAIDETKDILKEFKEKVKKFNEEQKK